MAPESFQSNTESSRSNTGAQTPERESKQERESEQVTRTVLGFVHYITCSFPCKTIPCETMLDDLMDFLGGEWIVADSRRNGYTKRLCCGGMSLSFQGRRDMGVSLEVTGEGCQDLEKRTKEKGWRVFLAELLQREARFSRLDVALDDHAGILNLNEIEHCCLAQLVVSHFEKADPKPSIDLKTGHEILTGFVFGKGGSKTILRIYDKALEAGKVGPHMRVELQTRSTRANALARRIVEDGEKVIAGIIAATVDFKVEGNGMPQYRYRWETQPWWKEFLGEVEKIHLSVPQGERSLERSMKALSHQYGMTMARIVDVYGPGELLEIAKKGKVRLEKRFNVTKSRQQRRKAC